MIQEYQNMTLAGQESFLAHSAAELVQSMYYGKDVKGLTVLIRNLETVTEYARNCLSCLDILRQKSSVYTKINLLLEFLGQNGLSEEFVEGLQDISDKALDCLEGSPSEEEESLALRNIRLLIDRKNDEFER